VLTRLRFAHAEIVIPLAALMRLPYSNRQVPVAETYTYATNPWRGKLVTPYAVNIQWDVYANTAGVYLVKMLYNEREMLFKTGCRSISPGSHYYLFDELKRCYGYT
ncbi:MAG: histidine-type phosphatase, partial [bacterium]